MATASMNTVQGKIVVKETGAGCPNLLVVIYDIDPDTQPEEVIAAISGNALSTVRSASNINVTPKNILGGLGDRIGSMLTGQDGGFTFSYEDAEFRIRNKGELRPDLFLLVLAPEQAARSFSDMLLFYSTEIRQNAGRVENYLIQIPQDQLSKAGALAPAINESGNAVQSKIDSYIARKSEQKQLRQAITQYNTEQIDEEKAASRKFRTAFEGIIKTDPTTLRGKGFFVDKNTTIPKMQIDAVVAGVQVMETFTVIDPLPTAPQPTAIKKGIPINLVLFKGQGENGNSVDDTAAFSRSTIGGTEYFVVEDKDVQRILFKKASDENYDALLISNNPISKYCREKSSQEKCALEHLLPDLTGHDEGSGQPGDSLATPPVGVDAGTSLDDIPRYLQQILGASEPNASNTTLGRPTTSDVQDNVDGFKLNKSPADVTAFYDFHSLQIAFDHVWTQLLDATLVDLGQKADNILVNSGRPGLQQTLSLTSGSVKALDLIPILAAAGSINTWQGATPTIPSDVAMVFDISLLEFMAMTGDEQDKIEQLAKSIIRDELGRPSGPLPNLPGWFGNSSNNTAPQETLGTLRKREQGERLIENVRLNKPYSAHQILKDLHDRLLGKYEFTIFAADRDYHAVNFGLLNTYRQQWEPICYQAGELVRTMPLSPKEERKYSVKTTTNIKSVRKEAEKNSSNIRNEQDTTGRAEAEIINKAQDKTNFTLSTDGKFNLGIYKGDAKTTFGVDAEKESAQTKKDFREAVIKAAQEYRDERSLDVETETTFNSEYSESGTIVNPNDELSVTYLFYELQRRFRVSEQIYRVIPVVMVAQQVPSPEQITEAWIMANAWILNRFILDDSFKYALQYITSKNVGNDYALRELRKNLIQQRHLVETLNIELAQLKNEANNRYVALEKSITARIDEQHRENSDGLLNDVSDWLGTSWLPWGSGHQDQPDPEAAKARELAASDAQRYAVEKAERMAAAVQQETNALHQLTAEYIGMMREHLDNLTRVQNLIVHIKENIFYYMQSIWSMEPSDQRYMRLYKVQVPQFEATRTCLVEVEPDPDDVFESFRAPGNIRHKAWLQGMVKRNPDGTPAVTYKPLVEVADLDTVLGFKGNYIIFPMKQHNALTEFMAAPYVDSAFGAMDPDQLSNVNLEEFSRYICCLHAQDPAEYERVKPILEKWLTKLLADPLRNGDEIIIPTGSLFIEMLPSGHTLLEDFKLRHREMDVNKVQEEVNRLKLENLRYAKRILTDRLEDPDVDKNIVVHGGINPVLDPDNP